MRGTGNPLTSFSTISCLLTQHESFLQSQLEWIKLDNEIKFLKQKINMFKISDLDKKLNNFIQLSYSIETWSFKIKTLSQAKEIPFQD